MSRLFQPHKRAEYARRPGSVLWQLAVEAPNGGTLRLLVSGRGYGHGVGMCQWGAIGRARAGFDFRSILSTYYPGTQLRRVA